MGNTYCNCDCSYSLWICIVWEGTHFACNQMTVACKLNKEPWGKRKSWYLKSSLSFFKIYFILAQWIVPPPTAPIFSFKSNLAYSLDSEETEIAASRSILQPAGQHLVGTYLVSRQLYHSQEICAKPRHFTSEIVNSKKSFIRTRNTPHEFKLLLKLLDHSFWFDNFKTAQGSYFSICFYLYPSNMIAGAG